MIYRDEVACDNCGNHEASIIFHNLDYISTESFPVMICTTCGLARTQFDHTKNLAKYYPTESYYGTEEGRRFLPIIEWVIALFHQVRVRAFLKYYPENHSGRILDIGCGRGLMLIELQADGWECYGTEISEDLANMLQNKHQIQIFTESHLFEINVENDFFDVITLWHSLEHVEFPIQTIVACFNLLKPNGLLVIEVPNFSSWQSKLGKGKWFHLDTPRHLYHFSVENLASILTEKNFIVQSKHTFSGEHGFYGMLQTLLNHVTTEPNVMYTLLKKQLPHKGGFHLIWNVFISVLLLPILLPTSVILELLATLWGQGGIIRIVAQKQ